jgi:hypothetical protein
MVSEETWKGIDCVKYVIPLGPALQGHLEAGTLWEHMANSILKDPELGFKDTTHERNLYRGVVCGETVYICCQVDDFSITSDTCATADHIISVVNSHATTTSQGIGETMEHREHCCYNGVDIWQTQDYIKISCKTYVDRLLQTHNSRLITGTFQPITRDCVLLSVDGATSLQLLQGPAEDTKEHSALESTMGFLYQQVLD